MKKNVTIRYALQRGLFEAASCGIVSYCVATLLTRGYKASEAGLILFAADILSFLLQPVVASIADKSKKNILNKLIALEECLAAVLVFVALYFIKSRLVFGLFYMLGITMMDMNNSLFNAIHVYYKTRKWKINYELARSFGSVGFALTSLLYGYLMNKIGSDLVVTIGVGIAAVLMVISLSLPNDDESVVDEKKESVEASPLFVFIKNNAWFFISLFGVAFLSIVHVMIENYLIEIVTRIGGNSSSVGIGLFVATAIEAVVLMFFAKIRDRIGTYKVLLIAGLSYLLKAVLFVVAKSLSVIYLAQLLQATTYTFLSPGLMYYSKECTKAQDMVKGQSMSIAFYTLGCAFGNLLGGVLITAFGVVNMLLFAAGFAAFGTLILFITVPKAKNCF